MSADMAAAVAWFRENPDERIRWIGSPPMGLFGNAQRHAVTIVQAALTDQPPADLPATLATVDDVRRVCEAAGLTEGSDQEWGSGDVAVYTGLRRGANLRSVVVELVRPDDTHRSGAVVQWSARFYPGAPAHLLAAAIQAARSTS